MKCIILIITLFSLAISENMDGKLNIGMKAPDFIASDQNNNQIQLYDYLGKYIVIYFFPKAFTPG